MLSRKQLDADKCVEESAKTALAYRAMLERLEWIETPYVGTPCPVCGNLKHMGHAADCELAAMLKSGEVEG